MAGAGDIVTDVNARDCGYGGQVGEGVFKTDTAAQFLL